ncbi:MAG: hypothetical protein BWY82_01567 [Verrucomicrobia bacterium ADurb.Bin474]|nr:MAG: hypothetical protein BWY82_01567 [Verrucomicrobia bacterium ADurb.Bin474]
MIATEMLSRAKAFRLIVISVRLVLTRSSIFEVRYTDPESAARIR